MKNLSNTPLPNQPVKWKDDWWLIHFNHADEGTNENGQQQYSADMTITQNPDDIAGAIKWATENPKENERLINGFE
jgi:hypothetical protein